MPTANHIPRPSGDRLVYDVPSDRNPKVCYRADIVANGGYGWCSCTDFATRRQPAIDRKEPMGTRAVLCKHLIRARRMFLNDVLPMLAKQEQHPPRHERR